MAKKKKQSTRSELDGLILADGKETIADNDGDSKDVNTYVDPDIKKVRDLERILGIKQINPFGTYDLNIFKEKLNEMTLVDMQHLCEKIGIFASGSRLQIKEKLLRQFKIASRGSVAMTSESPSLTLDPSNPDHQKAIKILGEI